MQDEMQVSALAQFYLSAQTSKTFGKKEAQAICRRLLARQVFLIDYDNCHVLILYFCRIVCARFKFCSSNVTRKILAPDQFIRVLSWVSAKELWMALGRRRLGPPVGSLAALRYMYLYTYMYSSHALIYDLFAVQPHG